VTDIMNAKEVDFNIGPGSWFGTLSDERDRAKRGKERGGVEKDKKLS